MGTTYKPPFLHTVTDVEETEDIYRVNRLMKNGWILLAAWVPNHQKEVIRFSLGKIPKHVDMQLSNSSLL